MYCTTVKRNSANNKTKWNIIINWSYRSDGKVQKIQKHLCVITDSDIAAGTAEVKLMNSIAELSRQGVDQLELERIVDVKVEPILSKGV